MRVNLCLCHLSAWNIYHSLAPGSLSPSSMIKAKHPVLTPSCAATAETRVRTSVRAGKDIIKNLPCDSKPVSGAFPFSRWKHSSGNRESVWPGDCGDTVNNILFQNLCGNMRQFWISTCVVYTCFECFRMLHFYLRHIFSRVILFLC